MSCLRRSIWSALAGLAVAAFSTATSHWRTAVSPTVASIVSAARLFVADYITPLIETIASFARDAVKAFLQPNWLVASMARLAHAVRTAMKSWNDRHQAHYRAPGSWVACGST